MQYLCFVKGVVGGRLRKRVLVWCLLCERSIRRLREALVKPPEHVFVLHHSQDVSLCTGRQRNRNMRDIDTLGMSDRARDEVFWRRTVLAFLYFACLKPLSKLSNGFRSGRLVLNNRFTREPTGCSWDRIAPGSLFAKNARC